MNYKRIIIVSAFMLMATAKSVSADELNTTTVEITETESTTEVQTTEKETTKKHKEKPTKVSTKGVKYNTGVYIKKKIYAYNLYKKKACKVYKGIRYQAIKKCNNGYVLLSVGNKKVLVKNRYITSKCNANSYVNTEDKKYSYKDMLKSIKKLTKSYGTILTDKIIGKSVDKREIHLLTLGNTKAKKTIYIESAIHAREWMNTQLIMKIIEDYCRGYDNKSYSEKKYSNIFNKVKIIIVPMVNPDGVTISQYGPSKINNVKYRNRVISIGKGHYSRWKANARGVDLNRNFEEGFIPGRGSYSSMEYPGKKPLSEPELKAIVKMINENNPTAVICYHQAGEVMYYRKKTKLLNLIHNMIGYFPIREAGKEYGCFSDFLDRKGIPNCTVETGIPPAPVSHTQFNKIYKTNKNVIVAAAKLYSR